MFVLCLFFLAVLHGAVSQDCIPDPVEGLRLDADSRLHWQDSTNCVITMYLIYMTPVSGGETRLWDSLFPYVHIFSLPMCELFEFRVVAVANVMASEPTYLTAQVPAMPGTNVTVTHIKATPQTENSVYLEWELDPEYAHCVQFFRVVHWDGESVPVDTYTSYDSVLLDELAPCTTFEFTVTPIYNTEAEGGIGYVIYETPAHSLHLPRLVEVRPGISYVDMTWALPPYQTNRCPISSIIVDGSPFMNATISITDSTSRPNIPLHIDSLQPDRMYLFRISIVNTAGPSQPIPIAIQTLPAPAAIESN